MTQTLEDEPTTGDVPDGGDHNEHVTDPARVGYAEEQPNAEESRLGTCPVELGGCGGKFADIAAHAAVEHPDMDLGLPTDPDELEAMAARIRAARAADKVRAEENASGGIHYDVSVDDSVGTVDKAS